MTLMSEFIEKLDLPVDGDPHEVPYYPVHMSAHPEDYSVIRIWTLSSEGDPRKTVLQVFDENQPIPPGAEYIRTIEAAQGMLAWHVFDVTGVGPKDDR